MVSAVWYASQAQTAKHGQHNVSDFEAIRQLPFICATVNILDRRVILKMDIGFLEDGPCSSPHVGSMSFGLTRTTSSSSFVSRQWVRSSGYLVVQGECCRAERLFP